MKLDDQNYNPETLDRYYAFHKTRHSLTKSQVNMNKTLTKQSQHHSISQNELLLHSPRLLTQRYGIGAVLKSYQKPSINAFNQSCTEQSQFDIA